MRGYKATNKNLMCRDFQFEVGKTYKHEGEIELCESGFHFCTKLLDCLTYYAPTERFFIIEANGVSDEINSYDSKRVCNEITLIEEISLPVDESFQLEMVQHCGYLIKYITTPSEKVQIAAVNRTGCAIRYIENPSELVQLVAVQENVWAITYIDNPSKKIKDYYENHK